MDVSMPTARGTADAERSASSRGRWRRCSARPRPRRLELCGQREQHRLTHRRADELDPDRQPVLGLVQRQRDRRLAGDVRDRRERRERAGACPLGTSPTLVSKVPIGTGGWTSVGDRRTSTSENVLAMKWRAKAPMPDVATRKSTPLVALALS